MMILIAEDDPKLRSGLAELMELEGHRVLTAECGRSALAAFEKDRPQFCIFDVSMPGMDGFELCKAVRKRDPDVPVLFLTARNEEIDRLLGLGVGADDYMGKPFSAQELIARVKAISRRSLAGADRASEREFALGDLRIDPLALRAHRADAVIDLSVREVAVLQLLHRRTGRVVSRDELYDECWGQSHFANSRAVDQFVSGLRRKIEIDPAEPALIKTVHGAGYRYDR